MASSTYSSASEGAPGLWRALRPAIAILAVAIAGCAFRGPLLAPHTPEDLPTRVELADVPFHPQTRYQCGPAALATILGAHGITVTPESLEPSVYLPGRRGTLQAELIAHARTFDLIPYVLPSDIGALFAEVAAGRPVLVLQNFGLRWRPVWHYAVVVGYDLDADRVLLRSGTRERRNLYAGRFMGTWHRADQWAIVLLDPGELPTLPDPGRYREAVSAFEATRGPQAAGAAWRAAAERWPDDAVAWVGIANGLYADDDLNGATAALKRAAAIAPDDPVVRNNLAHVLARRGCHADARVHIDAGLAAIDVDHPRYADLTTTASDIGHVNDNACH